MLNCSETEVQRHHKLFHSFQISLVALLNFAPTCPAPVSKHHTYCNLKLRPVWGTVVCPSALSLDESFQEQQQGSCCGGLIINQPEGQNEEAGLLTNQLLLPHRNKKPTWPLTLAQTARKKLKKCKAASVCGWNKGASVKLESPSGFHMLRQVFRAGN